MVGFLSHASAQTKIILAHIMGASTHYGRRQARQLGNMNRTLRSYYGAKANEDSAPVSDDRSGSKGLLDSLSGASSQQTPGCVE